MVIYCYLSELELVTQYTHVYLRLHCTQGHNLEFFALIRNSLIYSITSDVVSVLF